MMWCHHSRNLHDAIAIKVGGIQRAYPSMHQTDRIGFGENFKARCADRQSRYRCAIIKIGTHQNNFVVAVAIDVVKGRGLNS